jgi:hypothetical protein
MAGPQELRVPTPQPNLAAVRIDVCRRPIVRWAPHAHLRVVLPSARPTLLVLLALFLCSCDRSRGPTPLTPVLRVTVAGGAASVLDRRDQRVQLVATYTPRMGANQDVTAVAQWSSSNVEVVTVTTAGLVMIVRNGDAQVRGTYQDVSDVWQVRVAIPPPRLIVDAPSGGTVGLTTIFRWRVENAQSAEVYRFRVHLDKGVDACNGAIEETFDAGNATCLDATLDRARYDGFNVGFAVRVDDLSGNSVCQRGQGFRVDRSLPPPAPDPSCSRPLLSSLH